LHKDRWGKLLFWKILKKGTYCHQLFKGEEVGLVKEDINHKLLIAFHNVVLGRTDAAIVGRLGMIVEIAPD
jgi:hypothetical protein